VTFRTRTNWCVEIPRQDDLALRTFAPEELFMKIIAYDNFKPNVTLEDLKPYLRDEVSNVWRLWKAGVVRENYARADVGGVVIVFECKDVAEVQQYIADFPLTKAGLIEWQYIPLGSPLPLEFLFDPTIDVAEPFDRTKGAGKLEASAT
jgi:hypothetical protein